MNVYVDGFNLYHGLTDLARRESSKPHWKWLDLCALSRRLAPNDNLHRLRYFTARVTKTNHDPQLEQRQQVYLRALQTFPVLSIHYGQFSVHPKRMALDATISRVQQKAIQALGVDVHRHPDGRYSVPVLRTEEKGSDVNLATYLLVDAFRADFEKALVVSNDTDLCEAIRIVATEQHLPVVVVNPRGHTQPAAALQKVATETRRLRLKVVVACQLPPTLTDATGTISRPANW